MLKEDLANLSTWQGDLVARACHEVTKPLIPSIMSGLWMWRAAWTEKEIKSNIVTAMVMMSIKIWLTASPKKDSNVTTCMTSVTRNIVVLVCHKNFSLHFWPRHISTE